MVSSSAARRRIPAFALYGEAEGRLSTRAEILHVESVQSRSHRYHWEIDAHVHHGLHQVIWLTTGAAEVRLDETRTQCVGPAAIIVAPGVVHAFRFARNTEGFVLTASAGALVEGEGAAFGGAVTELFNVSRAIALEANSGEAARLAALFTALLAEFNAPDMAGGPIPMWLARAALWRLAQEVRQRAGAQATPRPQRALIARFMALVEEHHLKHWSVARYARVLGLSPERLNRMLRAECGRTALELIHTRVAREAQRRLLYVAVPVAKLAYELGFADPAYFSRFFKRQVGVSPAEFRSRTRMVE